MSIPMNGDKKTDKPSSASAREDRLAHQLRENLKKRKARQREKGVKDNKGASQHTCGEGESSS